MYSFCYIFIFSLLARDVLASSSSLNEFLSIPTQQGADDHEDHDDHDHDHDHDDHSEHIHNDDKKDDIRSLTTMMVVETLLATFFISVFPILIILVVPLTSTVNGKAFINKQWLKSLLAFAVGGLLGDVFLHLIPHAIAHSGAEHHDHDQHGDNHTGHDHNHGPHTIVGIQVLCGMFFFFLIEKIAVLYSIAHGHGHSHGDKSKGKSQRRKEDSKEEKEPKESEAEKITRERLRVAAFLNIIADTVHNMTDGMAIAASFMVSQRVGFGTTVAVMIHEIPHEIGDLAILVQSGISKRKVIAIQLGTALGAMVGAIFGLFLGTQSDSTWIIPFTAGGFIYVATADVIPQLFVKSNVIQTIKEAIFMCIGTGAMLLITYIE